MSAVHIQKGRVGEDKVTVLVEDSDSVVRGLYGVHEEEHLFFQPTSVRYVLTEGYYPLDLAGFTPDNAPAPLEVHLLARTGEDRPVHMVVRPAFGQSFYVIPKGGPGPLWYQQVEEVLPQNVSSPVAGDHLAAPVEEGYPALAIKTDDEIVDTLDYAPGKLAFRPHLIFHPEMLRLILAGENQTKGVPHPIY